jgi:site-specific recombinase XerD
MTLIDEYKTYLENEDLSALTVIGYLADTRLFMDWFKKNNREDFALENVTPSDVREYRQHLQTEQNLKASTVNRKLASLSSLMNWGIESGRISSNPAAKMKYVKQAAQSPKWLDKNEQYALQRAMEKDVQLAQLRYPKRWLTRRRDMSIMNFMLNTGLRLSETISLKLDDVEISERKGQVLVRQGKGNKERVVPLNADAREAVNEWLKVRPQTNCSRLWLSIESGTDEGLTGRAVQRVLKRYGEDAGIEKLTPHVLRHSFAKNLTNKGVGIERWHNCSVMRISTRHRSISSLISRILKRHWRIEV